MQVDDIENIGIPEIDSIDAINNSTKIENIVDSNYINNTYKLNEGFRPHGFIDKDFGIQMLIRHEITKNIKNKLF